MGLPVCYFWSVSLGHLWNCSPTKHAHVPLEFSFREVDNDLYRNDSMVGRDESVLQGIHLGAILNKRQSVIFGRLFLGTCGNAPRRNTRTFR